MKTCAHWNDIGCDHGGYCSLHERSCSFGVCRNCGDYQKASRAQLLLRRVRIGDKVAAATKAFGIKPCAGCRKRQAALNGESADNLTTNGE